MKIALCKLQTHACSESVKTETGIYVCRNDFHLTSNEGGDCPHKYIVEIASQPSDPADGETPCCDSPGKEHCDDCQELNYQP